jgi:hypothetical protein
VRGKWAWFTKPRGGEVGLVLGFIQMKLKMTFLQFSALVGVGSCGPIGCFNVIDLSLMQCVCYQMNFHVVNGTKSFHTSLILVYFQ